MTINAADVKKLREQTGVGMMDCKKALTEAEGDFQKAVDILRTKGQATAEKRAGKTAAEGKVHTLIRDGVGVNVELNCETDFVARNDDFQALAEEIATLILDARPADLDALNALEMPGKGKSVATVVEDATGTIGEKIVLRRFVIFDAGDGFVECYNHMGGKIGVLVQLKGHDGSFEEARAIAKDVAMQVAAMNPRWVRPDEIPATELAKEREIQKARAAEEGKPENMLEKIAEGRMGKFYKEVCVLEQPFVKEQKIAVKDALKGVASKLGSELDLVKFSRFQVGEGLEA